MDSFVWMRGRIDPRGNGAGSPRLAAAGVVPVRPAQDWAQLAPAAHWHCEPHRHAAPHWHCGPQAPAACAAACWQPQVQPVPGQVLQSQVDGWVVFMGFLSGCIDDGMSSMAALS